MESIEQLIGNHSFFRGLGAEYVQLLKGCAAGVHFETGAYIRRESEETGEFHLIVKGGVALEVYSPVKGAVTVLTVGPGDILGWSWLITPYRSHFDARAVEPTYAIRLDATCLRKKFAQDPALELALYKRFVPIIVGRMEALTMQLLDLYSSQR